MAQPFLRVGVDLALHSREAEHTPRAFATSGEEWARYSLLAHSQEFDSTSLVHEVVTPPTERTKIAELTTVQAFETTPTSVARITQSHVELYLVSATYGATCDFELALWLRTPKLEKVQTRRVTVVPGKVLGPPDQTTIMVAHHTPRVEDKLNSYGWSAYAIAAISVVPSLSLIRENQRAFRQYFPLK